MIHFRAQSKTNFLVVIWHLTSVSRQSWPNAHHCAMMCLRFGFHHFSSRPWGQWCILNGTGAVCSSHKKIILIEAISVQCQLFLNCSRTLCSLVNFELCWRTQFVSWFVICWNRKLDCLRLDRFSLCHIRKVFASHIYCLKFVSNILRDKSNTLLRNSNKLVGLVRTVLIVSFSMAFKWFEQRIKSSPGLKLTWLSTPGIIKWKYKCSSELS